METTNNFPKMESDILTEELSSSSDEEKSNNKIIKYGTGFLSIN